MSRIVVLFFVKIRYGLLGFGLSGLHYDDFFPRVIFIVITGLAVSLIVDMKDES